MTPDEVLAWLRKHPAEADSFFDVLIKEGILKRKPLGRPTTGICRKQYGLRVTDLEERLMNTTLYAVRWKDKTCHKAVLPLLTYYKNQPTSIQVQILQHPIPSGKIRPVRRQRALRLSEGEYIAICTALYGYRYAVSSLAAPTTALLRYHDEAGKAEQEAIEKRQQPSKAYRESHMVYQEEEENT